MNSILGTLSGLLVVVLGIFLIQFGYIGHTVSDKIFWLLNVEAIFFVLGGLSLVFFSAQDIKDSFVEFFFENSESNTDS